MNTVDLHDTAGMTSSPSKALQLLERCAFKAVLQLSRFSDVKLPPLRLKLTLPELHFHLSPAKLQRVMRIVNAALPSANFWVLSHTPSWKFIRIEGSTSF